jgi:hypothetical protein
MSFQFPGLSVSTCDCHTLHTRIGPPPLFRLQPPPELDAQTLEILGITSHPSCPNVNSTTVISSETNNLLNSSPFLVATSLVILALIILLLLFIVAACLLVRTNRRKLTIATEKLNRNYLISNSSGSDNSTNDHTTVSIVNSLFNIYFNRLNFLLQIFFRQAVQIIIYFVNNSTQSFQLVRQIQQHLHRLRQSQT